MGKKRKKQKNSHYFEANKKESMEQSDFGRKLKSAIDVKESEQKGTAAENELIIKNKTHIYKSVKAHQKPVKVFRAKGKIPSGAVDKETIEEQEHLKPTKQKTTVYISGQYWHQLPQRPHKHSVTPKGAVTKQFVAKKADTHKTKSKEIVDQRPNERWREVKPKTKISIKPQNKKIVHKHEKAPDKSRLKLYNWQMNQGEIKDERDIVIGFDFGTSCTKVVLQDKQVKRAFVVPFDVASSKYNRYLLATKLFVNLDGTLSLDHGKSEVTDLKSSFIGNPGQVLFESKTGQAVTSTEIASAYIGLVLIEVRNWFFKEKSKEYKHIRLNWELNIGLSSRSYDNHELYNLMRLAALAGWNLTLFGFQTLSLSDVKKNIFNTQTQISSNTYDETKGQLHLDNVCPIPEIIAEVIGFAQSQMRHDGMYLIIDIGASTLDVSMFILHKKDYEDNYTILYAEVGQLGAFKLHKHRVDESKNIIERRLGDLICSCDGISPIPEPGKYLSPSSKDYEDFKKIDWDFFCKCSMLIRQVIGETKKHKNPLCEEWENGLPVFICGGGSKMEFYQKTVKHAEDRLKKSKYRVDIVEKKLPKPDNLETDDIPPSDYHRFAVSYGLSFSEVDIGRIIPQRKVTDIMLPETVEKDIDKWFVDKSMV